MEYFLSIFGIILHRSNPSAMLSKKLQQHCIKKILFNDVLILLGKHCTGQNLMQCCPRDSRQHCQKKIFVFFFLNTLGTKLGSSKPCEMLSERLQATLYRKKYCPILS